MNNIRELRKTAKLTQTQLARIIGIVQTGVSQLELDTLRLSLQLANRIHARFGVQISMAEGRPSVVLRDSKGDPYTLESYEAWKKSLANESSPGSVDTDMAHAVKLLGEVVGSHADPKSFDYNDCDKPGDECQWCFEAKQIIQNHAIRDLKVPS